MKKRCIVCGQSEMTCTCADEAEEYEEETKQCPDCGGQMEWCESCQMWSQICCVEFGTCECS